jgi:predicted transcriptional regulator with HTH domain
MIDQLFGSKTRVKLLQLFYSNPNRSFYVREITRKVDEQINSVRRELANMLSVGIITSDSSNNKLYYEVNQKFEHYEALRSIFGSKSAVTTNETKEGDSNDTVAQLRLLGSVELAFLSGVFTRDELSPLDILIVGDVNRTRLRKFISAMEKEEGRELRYSCMDGE